MQTRRAHGRWRAAMVALLAALASSGPTAQTAVPRQPPRNDDYLVLYDQVNYRGRPREYRGVVSSTGMATVRSVTIGRGRWELCERAKFAGRCVVLDASTGDLRRAGLQGVGSVRPLRGVAPPPATMAIVLYDRTSYRGTSRQFIASVGNTRWNAAVRSVRVGRSAWEICDGVNFRGRCSIVNRDEADLGRLGFRGPIASVRPVRTPR